MFTNDVANKIHCDEELERVMIPLQDDRPITKVFLFSGDLYSLGTCALEGLKFFDKNKKLIFEIGGCGGDLHEIDLEDDERIIGVKSRTHPSYPAYHEDLQFIIQKQ